MTKRSDRLAALMARLQDGQVHRAEDLALDLGISLRTVYRDMEVLMASGVPVSGARGSGYRAEAAFSIPPMHVTEPELEALHLALAILGESGMEDLAEAARSLSAKYDAVLPEDAAKAAPFGFAAYPLDAETRSMRHLPAIRSAIRARQKLRIALTGLREPHVIRPLRVDYWGRVWLCIAWDEAINDFNRFRVDEVQGVTALPGLFVEEPGKTLADFDAR
jgi:predicted DNA-binding transcriptional regulator YafY